MCLPRLTKLARRTCSNDIFREDVWPCRNGGNDPQMGDGLPQRRGIDELELYETQGHGVENTIATEVKFRCSSAPSGVAVQCCVTISIGSLL